MTESVIHAEVARQADPDRLAVLRAGVELVLEEVKAAVDDWAPMRARAMTLARELRRESPPVQPQDLSEAEAFLEWLGDDNFTFLGYREYELEQGSVLTAVPGRVWESCGAPLRPPQSSSIPRRSHWPARHIRWS